MNDSNVTIFDGINKFLEWSMRFAILNLLWVAFNLPISFLVATMALTNSLYVITINWIIIGIMAPVVFFPATTAMFGVVRRWTLKDFDISITSSYWRYYKENYLRSVLGGSILTILWFILALDIYFLYMKSVMLTVIFAVISVFLFVATNYFFATLVHNKLNILTTFKNALIFTVFHPIRNMAFGIVNCMFIYLSLTKFTFLLPFFFGSIIAYVAFYQYNKKFEKIQHLKMNLRRDNDVSNR
jgi:uncharacterized membrane protein YesL